MLHCLSVFQYWHKGTNLLQKTCKTCPFERMWKLDICSRVLGLELTARRGHVSHDTKAFQCNLTIFAYHKALTGICNVFY